MKRYALAAVVVNSGHVSIVCSTTTSWSSIIAAIKLFFVISGKVNELRKKTPYAHYTVQYSALHHIAEEAKKVVFFLGVAPKAFDLFVGDLDGTLTETEVVTHLKREFNAANSTTKTQNNFRYQFVPV